MVKGCDPPQKNIDFLRTPRAKRKKTFGSLVARGLPPTMTIVSGRPVQVFLQASLFNVIPRVFPQPSVRKENRRLQS